MSVLFCQNPAAYFLLYDQHESLSNFLPRCISDNGGSGNQTTPLEETTKTVEYKIADLVDADMVVLNGNGATVPTTSQTKVPSAAGSFEIMDGKLTVVAEKKKLLQLNMTKMATGMFILVGFQNLHLM